MLKKLKQINVLKVMSELKAKSESVLNSRSHLSKLVKDSQLKISESNDKIADVRDDAGTLVDMLKGYLNGSYRQVPWKSLVSITGALIYFVNPFDAIPDFILAVGLLDDLMVLQFVIKQVQKDIVDFKKQQNNKD